MQVLQQRPVGRDSLRLIVRDAGPVSGVPGSRAHPGCIADQVMDVRAKRLGCGRRAPPGVCGRHGEMRSPGFIRRPVQQGYGGSLGGGKGIEGVRSCVAFSRH